MNHILKIAFLRLIICSFILVAPSYAEQLAQVGKTAPDFKLLGSDGKEHQLSDFKGKIVVLEWFNHECPFVKKHYHMPEMNMQSLQKKYQTQGVVWLSINSSAEGKQGHLTAADAQKVIKEKGASPSYMLLDPTGVVGKQYGARTTPHMFIVDTQMVLQYAGAIDDHPSADPDDIAGAKNYVAQALDQLLQGNPVIEPSTDSYGCSIKYAL